MTKLATMDEIMEKLGTTEGWHLGAEKPPRADGYAVLLRTVSGALMQDWLRWTGTEWKRLGSSARYSVQAWRDAGAGTDGEPEDGGQDAGTAVAAAPETGIVRRAEYEARIRLYREQIGTGYIGIGRTLLEAKEAGVVPHGEWESWVETTTGLTIRQAQRCMRAAREIKDGSAMAQLEMSKALALLSSGLGEEDRESLAARAAGDGQSLAELRQEIDRLKGAMETERQGAGETIKALKLKVLEESGAATEIRARLREAESEREQLVERMKAADAAYKVRISDEKARSYEQGRKDEQSDALEEARKLYQGKLDFKGSQIRQLVTEIDEARKALEEERAAAGKRWDAGFQAREAEVQEKEEKIRKLEAELAIIRAEGSGDGTQAGEDPAGLPDLAREALEAKNREIDELQAELEAAEAREEKRAAELAALRKERTQAGMDAARGIGVTGFGAMDLTAAVRDFIGRAGVLPQMGGIISGMGEPDREMIRAQVDTVAEWVRSARAALGIVTADGSIQ